jgi:coproporphyrinogen III oxidase-like Fe-S oxidoreductase
MATHLTHRGKNVVRALTGLSLLIVIGAGCSAVGNASEQVIRSTPATNGYQQIVVGSGETLWSIASLVAGEGSVTAIEEKIVEANQLTTPDLTAGMRLWVPST